jgi:hypothetical protein
MAGRGKDGRGKTGRGARAVGGSLALALLLLGPLAARAQVWPLDGVQVYYPRGDCQGQWIELEVWNRQAGRWQPHPVHPRVPPGTCQPEDAGVLFNEIRWRCVEPPGPGPAPSWVVGLEVFDPEIMERCDIRARPAEARRTAIDVITPREGEPVRGDVERVALEGNVRIGGIEGLDYDLILALDRSSATREREDWLDAQIDSARALVRALRPRLGAVRVGLVWYPNLPPGRGEEAGAHTAQRLTDDPAQLEAALRALRAKGASGFSTFSAGLERALAELTVRRPGGVARPGARKVVVIAAEASGALPLGDGAADVPGFRTRTLELAERARREGVALHLYALGGLAEEPSEFVEAILERSRGSYRRIPATRLGGELFADLRLPVLEDVRVSNRTTGSAEIAADLHDGTRFAALVPVAAGENRIRIRARTSDGVWTERDWPVVFDASLIYERILAGERERIRRAREKRLRLDPEWGAGDGTRTH